MHVFWQREFDKTLNLPLAFGPLSNFQIRRRGSVTPIQLSEPMTSAWQLQMPLTEAVPEEFDEFYEDGSLASLAGDRERRDLSQETYWSEMKRRGVYSHEFNAVEERKRLLTETPGDTVEQMV
jgi:hypothetical protein